MAPPVSLGHHRPIRTAFYVLVGLHVTCAIVGFGSIAISGAYGAIGRDVSRPSSAEELRRYFSGKNWLEYLVLAVPFLGAAALAVKPGGHLVQLWDGAALTVWVLAVAVLFGVVRPSERVIRGAFVTAGSATAGTTGTAGSATAAIDSGASSAVRRAGTRLVWGSAATDLAFFVALLLMVFRPN